METDVEIQVRNAACPYCNHAPYNIYQFSSHSFEKWYCDDCSKQLAIEDLPPEVHGRWVIVSQ